MATPTKAQQLMAALGSFQGAAQHLTEAQRRDAELERRRAALFAGKTAAEQELLEPLLRVAGPAPLAPRLEQRSNVFDAHAANQDWAADPIVRLGQDLWDATVGGAVKGIFSGGKAKPELFPRVREDIAANPASAIDYALTIPFGGPRGAGRGEGRWSKYNPKAGVHPPTLDWDGAPLRFHHGSPNKLTSAVRTAPKGDNVWPVAGSFWTNEAPTAGGYALKEGEFGALNRRRELGDLRFTGDPDLRGGSGRSKYLLHAATSGNKVVNTSDRSFSLNLNKVTKRQAREGRRTTFTANELFEVRPVADPGGDKRLQRYDIVRRRDGKLLEGGLRKGEVGAGMARHLWDELNHGPRDRFSEPQGLWGVAGETAAQPKDAIGLSRDRGAAPGPSVQLADLSAIRNPADLDVPLTPKLEERARRAWQRAVDKNFQATKKFLEDEPDTRRRADLMRDAEMQRDRNIYVFNEALLAARGREHAVYAGQANTLLTLVDALQNRARSWEYTVTKMNEGRPRGSETWLGGTDEVVSQRRTSPLFDAREMLHEMGFDGATHKGGRDGGHTVVIATKPGQVKPYYRAEDYVPPALRDRNSGGWVETPEHGLNRVRYEAPKRMARSRDGAPLESFAVAPAAKDYFDQQTHRLLIAEQLRAGAKTFDEAAERIQVALDGLHRQARKGAKPSTSTLPDWMAKLVAP